MPHIVLIPDVPVLSPVALLLYELELLNGSSGALRVMDYQECATARTPGHPAVIWACLTASNQDIHENLSCDETCPAMDLRIRDVGSPELLAEPCLIPEVGSLAISFQSDRWIRSTSRLKARRATHSFDPRCACSFPGRIITLRA